MIKAKVADIFSSVQGEGTYAGITQVFVRFYGCMCSCRFCDTPLTTYEKYSPLELYGQIKRFSHPYHSLCLTGGEPLLQKSFLKDFLRLLKYDGIVTYLETNGILAEAITELIADIDIVAMDFKLPSSTGISECWDEHQKFLKVALKKEVLVKMVICNETEPADLQQAVRLILKLHAQRIPVILQPNFFQLSKELLAKTRQLEKYCSRYLSSVQVIPQLHKLSGIK